jgi:RND superfamily putative drug exporter
MVKILGVGIASAILVDVTLVRLLVVPAALALLGHANWYLPRFLHNRDRRDRAPGSPHRQPDVLHRPGGRPPS